MKGTDNTMKLQELLNVIFPPTTISIYAFRTSDMQIIMFYEGAANEADTMLQSATLMNTPVRYIHNTVSRTIEIVLADIQD